MQTLEKLQAGVRGPLPAERCLVHSATRFAARPGRARSSPGSAGRLTARASRTQEIEVMVKEIDEDESGTIDFEEFKAMVRASPPPRAPRESRSPRADPPRLAPGR